MRLGWTHVRYWPPKLLGQKFVLPSLGRRVACSGLQRPMSAALIWTSLAVRRFLSHELKITFFISTTTEYSTAQPRHALFQLVTRSRRRTMYMRYLSVTIPSWASAILATPLQGPDGQTIELSKAPNLTTPDLLLPSNASIQDLNASSGNGLDIRCDGARYGFNPSLSDCEGARSYIPPDSEQYVFGERHTGLPTSTFPLPYIIMGGTSTMAENVPL